MARWPVPVMHSAPPKTPSCSESRVLVFGSTAKLSAAMASRLNKKGQEPRAFDLKCVDDAVVLEDADGPTHVDGGLDGPADAEHGAVHLTRETPCSPRSVNAAENDSAQSDAAPGVDHGKAGLVDVGLVGDHAGHEGLGGVVREVAAVVVVAVV